jgi:hypothetical protein
MTIGDELTVCGICNLGGMRKRMEPVTFRQLTDKGFVHCSVTIMIGTCDRCGAKIWDAETDNILDEAVRREYDKLA